MTTFLSAVSRLFDGLFYPFRAASPWFPLVLLSFFAGVLMLLVFRFTSNQSAIRRVKDRMQAHLFEVRLFPDQLGVVLRAYGRILRWTLAYLGHALVPLAVMTVPLVLLLVQMDLRLGHEPLRPRSSFLLKALAAGDASLEQASLRLPDGLVLTAPPLHIFHAPEKRQEVNWRLEAQRPGEFSVEVVVADKVFSKQVIVVEPGSNVRLSPARVRPDWMELLLESSEPPLPPDSPLHHILVVYPHRNLSLGRWELHWLVPFFVFSLMAAFAMKGVFRTEF
ncbi:MAG: hypothetical protein HY234_00175 [Acidobacteria bacterium]|nr:hypothetical protein [Acidobacteriota bacterium]